jgi:hypothetical protein
VNSLHGMAWVGILLFMFPTIAGMMGVHQLFSVEIGPCELFAQSGLKT